ncbi:phospho-N-acetylmuramoyl-pentapeptide-transferase [Patescibacteria group bacterium]|nr:phospho-N-acetylmuramoyl-pentapeptide-transferase [Patescibacteria group bacterium]MBU1868229.1 phospho-N-acetylmuramoyl-pentapeptide-transferase [Patescibacteria group bacterium]
MSGKLFGILLASMGFSGILIIPFINLLYKLKFRQPQNLSIDFKGQKTLYNKLHGWKVGTPIGGGILTVFSAFLFTLIFYAFTSFRMNWTSTILFVTLFSFGLLGFYDDVRKFFKLEAKGLLGLRIRFKFLLQWVPAFLIGYLLFRYMEIDSVTVPYLLGERTFRLGWLFVPIAAVLIVFFCNAFNITDGMDGLSGGLLVITLVGLWVLSGSCVHHGDIELFIATLVGALIPFLYFNIYPARLFMGDTGALAFGAMLAVVALMIDQAFILPILGGVFVVEAFSSLIQWASMWLRDGKKVFLIAPLHHHFEALGWDETKVTMRFWLAGIVLLFIALFIATFQF